MKIKQKIFTIYLFIVLVSWTIPLEPHCSTVKKIFFSSLNWLCSSGLIWLEAFKYINLTSKTRSYEIFGSQNYESQGSIYIKDVLKKYINSSVDWDQIEIKEIKPELRIFIQKPFICTDSIIYVNPDFYDPASDFRSEFEREALILEIGWIISTKYIQKSALFLMTLPILTNTGLNLLSHLAETAKNKQKEKRKISKLLSILSVVSYNCITKYILNVSLFNAYKKIELQKSKQTILKLLSSHHNLDNTKINIQPYLLKFLCYNY